MVDRQPAQATAELRHVAAEHPAEGVQLVEDDEAEPTEERGPALMVGKEPGVEHLRVGEHQRRVLPHPGALLGAGVAVVGAGDHTRELERGDGAELVVGEGLRGEQGQRGARPDRIAGGLRDRDLVAERLP